MLIISFDAVGDREFDELMKYPDFAAFADQAAVHREVSTVFLSNTYPTHASVATGVTPDIHGIRSNTEPFPKKHPAWVTRESTIKAKTIWQAAADKGIRTATVLWPVTSYSKSIRYNVPEEHVLPGQSQVIANLKAGSALLQLKLFMRHRRLLDGEKEPNLSNFATACMVDILKEYKPGLAMLHLISYDSLCHKYGKDSKELKAAYEALNRNLAVLLEAAGDERDVIIFSDHNQINVHTVLMPNDILVDMGLLNLSGQEYRAGENECFVECCGGAAFFHAGMLASEKIAEVKQKITEMEGFMRLLTAEELSGSGYRGVAFGFCAKAGYYFDTHASVYAANHGYMPDMPDYKVFYMIRGTGISPGCVVGGSLLEIAPLVSKRLGLDLALTKG